VPNRRRSKEIRTGEVAQDNFLLGACPCVVSSSIWFSHYHYWIIFRDVGVKIAVLVIGEEDANLQSWEKPSKGSEG
jgi:hypothetical protein